MIKSVTVQNPFVGDDPLVLNLPSSHEEHGIYIKSITGIGPDKATINTTSLAMEDGGIFNSAKSDIRNIVITLGFYESSILHNSIEDSRHLTYKYFPKKKEITLIFETDNRTLAISGYVESNEPDIFSKEETAQISIICPDPNFYDVTSYETHFGGIDGKFEFTYENNTVADEELVIFGGISPEDQVIVSSHNAVIGIPGVVYFEKTENPNIFNEWMYTDYLHGWVQTGSNKVLYNADTILGEIMEGGVHDIWYYGDEDIGVVLRIHFRDRATNIVMTNQEDLNQVLRIDTDVIEAILCEYYETSDMKIMPGDEIIVDSTIGNKSMYFTRGGDTLNILNAMGRDPKDGTIHFDTSWFKLHKGLNQFVFTAETGFDNIEMTMEGYTAYDGV